MTTVLLAGPARVQRPERHRLDVAAWTLRLRGQVVDWRDVGLETNPLVTAWARRALANGCAYADLLYCELDCLAASAN
jgi:hypothetical protein